MEENKYQETAIQLLREEVEQKAGMKMTTPKDFDFLSESIFESIHVKISPTTLKRIWGYLQYSNTPRSTSLSPLAVYAGYEGWDHFLESAEKKYGLKPERPKEEQTDETAASFPEKPESKERQSKQKVAFLTVATLLFSAILFFFVWSFQKSTEVTETQILRGGRSLLPQWTIA